VRVLSSSSAFATALLLLSLLAAALVRTCLSTAAAAANQHLAVHGLDYHLIFASASRVSSALRLDVHFCASFYAPDRDRAVRLQSQSSPQQPAGSGSHGSARRQRSTQEDNPGKLGGWARCALRFRFGLVRASCLVAAPAVSASATAAPRALSSSGCPSGLSSSGCDRVRLPPEPPPSLTGLLWSVACSTVAAAVPVADLPSS
jgi:hypothetical protein